MSPTPAASASLSTLPPELLLRVMEMLPTPRDLWLLVSADPRASRLVASASTGPAILDAVISRAVDADVVPPNMVHVLGLVALLRAGSSSSGRLLVPRPPVSLAALTCSSSWAQFRDAHLPTRRTMRPRYGQDSSSPAPPLREVLTGPGARYVSARQVLHLIRRVDCLAAECFDSFIARWMQTKPQHLVNKGDSYSFRPGGADTSVHVPGWKLRFEGYQYETRTGGPPTRAEMTLIQNGLWDLQLAWDLKAACGRSLHVADDCARLPWPSEDLRVVADMALSDLLLITGSQQTVATEAVASVRSFLQDRDEVLHGGEPTRLPSPAADRQGYYYSWPPYPGEELVGKKAGWGARWARTLCSRQDSPLRTMGFEPFRRLGIGIWSMERLAEFELLRPGEGASRSPKGELPDMNMYTNDMYFTWKSLLTADQAAELEASLDEDARVRAQTPQSSDGEAE